MQIKYVTTELKKAKNLLVTFWMAQVCKENDCKHDTLSFLNTIKSYRNLQDQNLNETSDSM